MKGLVVLIFQNFIVSESNNATKFHRTPISLCSLLNRTEKSFTKKRSAPPSTYILTYHCEHSTFLICNDIISSYPEGQADLIDSLKAFDNSCKSNIL